MAFCSFVPEVNYIIYGLDTCPIKLQVGGVRSLVAFSLALKSSVRYQLSRHLTSLEMLNLQSVGASLTLVVIGEHEHSASYHTTSDTGPTGIRAQPAGIGQAHSPTSGLHCIF